MSFNSTTTSWRIVSSHSHHLYEIDSERFIHFKQGILPTAATVELMTWESVFRTLSHISVCSQASSRQEFYQLWSWINWCFSGPGTVISVCMVLRFGTTGFALAVILCGNYENLFLSIIKSLRLFQTTALFWDGCCNRC